MVAMQLIGTKIRPCLIEGQASQVLNFPISLHTIFSCEGGGGGGGGSFQYITYRGPAKFIGGEILTFGSKFV